MLHSPPAEEDLAAIQRGEHPPAITCVEELTAYQLGMMLWHRETKPNRAVRLNVQRRSLRRSQPDCHLTLPGPKYGSSTKSLKI